MPRDICVQSMVKKKTVHRVGNKCCDQDVMKVRSLSALRFSFLITIFFHCFVLVFYGMEWNGFVGNGVGLSCHPTGHLG